MRQTEEESETKTQSDRVETWTDLMPPFGSSCHFSVTFLGLKHHAEHFRSLRQTHADSLFLLDFISTDSEMCFVLSVLYKQTVKD